ncbi:Glutamate-cysteine ligase catalytic subunit [Zancudomyces culisetae]|uniref:Glutamate--cysteine ligase n=1 Tax=Zancudomyces culisetae TaxID=1213189 RepID=A0A1R1PWJ6_ZANCU|nr:Glutamate-cysteine ligase catalytic subunit [Zancudomyces culisetae]|eukprot:OMH85297.1 Glutamate-cysteine ligase catalytic subunit [Zancudomyces culisetae]
MGLLSLGTPLDWQEAKKHAEFIRKNGIEQFLHVYNQIKDKNRDNLLWGDEIEYLVVELDPEAKKARLLNENYKIIERLQQDEIDYLENAEKGIKSSPPLALWRPEYGDFMIEGTPGEPYGSNLKDLLTVEKSMQYRRNRANSELKKNQAALSITAYPKMGQGDWISPHYEAGGKYAQSLFIPDEVINPHPRFKTLSANIRERRQAKVEINVPIFRDTNTPWPFIDPTIPWDRQKYPGDSEAKNGAAKENHVYMDAMAFGMGCCCLQVTFQASNVNEARRLNDQLAPVGAIMMALSAASPCYRGFVTDIDCRWNVISAAVDDRTPYERGVSDIRQGNERRITKSRYATIDSYLGSNDGFFQPEYNDVDLEYDHEIYKHLREAGGVDEHLARHIAHLFIRDPLVIFEEKLELDNTATTDHFENLQSTNWQNMRFKLPPGPGSKIGWRVEFRPIEAQFTDFENAAFAIFVVLLTRAILSFDLDFYLKVTKMDENMQRAHRRDAVNQCKFWFRKNVFPRRPVIGGGGGDLTKDSEPTKNNDNILTNGKPVDMNDEIEQHNDQEMTLDEIINGQQEQQSSSLSSSSHFPGLAPIVESYLDSSNIDIITRCQLQKYIDLIRKRATGESKTNALWIREFIASHPDYKHDSFIPDSTNYDLLSTINDISAKNTFPF